LVWFSTSPQDEQELIPTEEVRHFTAAGFVRTQVKDFLEKLDRPMFL
jgi:hypothetical protein